MEGCCLCRAATAPERVRYVNGTNYRAERKLHRGGRIHGGKSRGWRRRKQNKGDNFEAAGRRCICVCVLFSSPTSGLLPGTDVRRRVCRDGSHAGIYVCYFRPTMTNQTLAIKKGRGEKKKNLIPLQASKGFQRI